MKVIGMLLVFNDEDIIKEVIEHLISQGIQLVVLDNGSTDNSYKICEKFLGNGILDLKQFKTPTFIYHEPIIRRMLYDMAISQSPDWVIANDSDEILESAAQSSTLHESIEKANTEGYNMIQFNRFDFYITDNDDKSAKSTKDKLGYYSYYGDYLYRAWKYFPGIRVGYNPHLPVYPDGYQYKIYPYKFALRHYPFRSKEQVKKKLSDRTRGTNYLKKNEKLPSVVNYNLKNKIPDIVEHKLLTKYNEDGKWNYEFKYCPLLRSVPEKKEDLFTKDGSLKNKEPTTYELKLQLREESNKHFFSYVIYRINNILKSKKQGRR